MTLPILGDDALAASPSGFVLLVNLPWIRSLPLASVSDLTVTIDGEPVETRVVLGERRLDPAALASESGWWFIQDRLALEVGSVLQSGRHDVSVSFSLAIPYLQAGPDGPLTLPFAAARPLEVLPLVDGGTRHPVASQTSARPAAARDGSAPDAGPWTVAASAFNWTPEVIRAERSATDIAVGIVADGVASVIEIEPGQLWRSFPVPADHEVEELRAALDELGGSVSIVGASLDDWSGPGLHRSDDERFAFLVPQLRAAHRVGAHAVRLPIGQAGEPLLRRLLPTLHELDLALYEEIQGQQTPNAPGAASAIDTIAGIDDPHVRLLVDISMLMPSLPPSYLDQLRAGGVDAALLDRLGADWRDPATADAVVAYLRSGAVPPAVHTSFMNLLIRFGRSDASVLRGILPLVGAFHLKFWDLDDTDGRVSQPIRDLGAELDRSGFAGTLTSEWGGHEWLDDDPAAMTRAHLALAHRALRAAAAVR
ncbi:sugar phosphate isomerase/epimerase [Microbacterium sp. SS28]|uniref:sugar phosphate isomerase/epimerase n=1 Tax=Microbacterium sp. SS28 TaxID=2919948 RepID=UPI001FA980B1|nr:sugar phosphate isomerase/epimerase [Microbacterium sp. SS28]